MLDSASGRNLEEDDFSDVDFVISTMGVAGDLSVHNELIGVTSVMVDTAIMPQYIVSAPAQFQALPTVTPTQNIQGTPFQCAYMPNPKWQFFALNLPPCAQMAPSAVLSEREHLVLQQEEALKCEHQQLEAWKLGVEVERLALQLHTSQPQFQSPATKIGP